jgi:hypothetical protein
LGSCGVESNGISESENVIVLFVLKSVFVDINTASFICKTSFNDEAVGFAWWVDACCVEIFFNSDTTVNILEDGNLSLVGIFLNF